MTAIDIVIIALVIFAVVYGYKRGIIAQISSLVAIVAAIAACRLFANRIALWLEGEGYDFSSGIPEYLAPYSKGIITSIVIFIVVYLIVRILLGVIRKTVKQSAFGFVDGCLGSIFMTFVCLLLFSILLNFCQAFKQGGSVIDSSRLDDGKIAKAILDFAPELWGVATATLDTGVDNGVAGAGKNEKPISLFNCLK